jgi:hypothetical protein
MDVGEARRVGRVSDLSSGRRLLLLSFLMLFVELLLIRWAAERCMGCIVRKLRRGDR